MTQELEALGRADAALAKARSKAEAVKAKAAEALDSGLDSVATESVALAAAVDDIAPVTKSFKIFANILWPVACFINGCRELFSIYEATQSSEQRKTKIVVGLVLGLSYFAAGALAVAALVAGVEAISFAAFVAAPVLVIGIAFFGFYRDAYIARQQYKKDLTDAKKELAELQLKGNDHLKEQELLQKIKDLEGPVPRQQTRRAITGFVSLIACALIAVVALAGLGYAGPLAITGYALVAAAALFDFVDQQFFTSKTSPTVATPSAELIPVATTEALPLPAERQVMEVTPIAASLSESDNSLTPAKVEEPASAVSCEDLQSWIKLNADRPQAVANQEAEASLRVS